MDTFRFANKCSKEFWDDRNPKLGDEFAFGEYSDLATIQFLDVPRENIQARMGFVESRDARLFQPLVEPQVQGGGSKTERPTPVGPKIEHELDSANIEVFDVAKKFIDIYSIPDDDKERLLLQDFDEDKVLALQFVELIKQAARIRAAFKIHANTEIMARQLAIIGQELALFGARVIIPLVHPVSSETFLDRIRKSNAQQMIRGRIIRIHKTKKVALPEISLPKKVSTTTVKTHISGIQFPQATLCEMDPNHILTQVSPNTSVYIDAISIRPISEFPATQGQIPGLFVFDCFRQVERPIFPYDHNEPYIPHTIQIGADTNQSLYVKVFEYLRLLFQQYLFARPSGLDTRAILGPGINFKTAPTTPVQIPLVATTFPEHLITAAQMLGIALDPTYSTNIITDFIANESRVLYWRLMYSDRRSELSSTPDRRSELSSTSKLIDKLRADIESRNIAIKSANEHQQRTSRLEIIARLIETHFGRAKLSNLIRITTYQQDMSPSIGLLPTITIRAHNEDDLLEVLSPAERSFIQTEYERWTHVGPATIACEHMKLVNGLRHATSIKSVSFFLSSLQRILAHSTAAKTERITLLKCSLCNQDAICPHVIDVSQVIIDRGTRQQEREILSSYVNKVPERSIHYCRVCGEFFAWSLVVNSDVDQAESENENLVREIRHQILITQRYIRAQNVVDQMAFVRMIQRHIYPFIEAIERKFAVAQTSIASEFTAKLHIFITIYIFADCIVNMTQLGIVFDGFIPRDPQHIDAAAIKYATEKVMSIENIALNTVPGITRDVIQTNLITAIRELRGVSLHMPFESAPRDYRSSLMYDSLFSLLYFACNLANKRIATAATTPSKKRSTKPSVKGQKKEVEFIHEKNPKDPFDYEYDIFHLFGTQPQNPFNIYEQLFRFCPHTPTNISSVKNFSAETIVKIIIANTEQSTKLREFDFPLGTSNRAIAEHREKINEINAQIRAIEQRTREKYMDERRLPTAFITRDPKRGPLFVNRPGPLSYSFDINGIPHQWNILIFQTSDHKPLEMKLGSATAFQDARLTYADKKCSICGTLQSKVAELDESAIQVALDMHDEMENFFRFFELRCPVEGTHTINAGQECTKCGYTSVKASKLDKEYFDKYYAVFQDLTRETATSRRHDRRVSKEDEEITAEAQKIIESPWTFNYEVIMNAAAAFKVERNDIQTIGAREGLSRAELADESFVARVPKIRTDTRILTLRSVIFEILSLYSIMKVLSAHEKIQLHSTIRFIELLKQKLSATSSQLEAMAATLPALNDILLQARSGFVEPEVQARSGFVESRDVQARTGFVEPPVQSTGRFERIFVRSIELFAMSRKPVEIVDYYLETICTLLLAIKTSKVAPQLCEAFAQVFIDRVISRENMTIKGDRFNLSVVNGTKLADSEFTSQLVDFDGEKDIEQEERIDDDQKEELDPFSLDAFDVDDAGEEDVIDEGVSFTDPDAENPIIRVGTEVGW